MERNSLKQDHGINVDTRAIINNIGDSNNDKIQIKDSWKKCINQQRYEDQDGYMNDGFSWPPRCYTCSFCKREFRSAQALGGHMNVHRKDRARLRSHYSPPSPTLVDSHDHGQYTTATTTTTTILNLNLKPNPNPNFPPPPPPPPSSSTSPFPSSLPSLISPPQPPPPRIFSVPSKACHSDQKWVNVDGNALFDPPPFPLNLKPKWDLNNKMKINAQSLCGVGVGVGDQCDGFRSQEDHLNQHGCNMTNLNKAAAEINVRLDLEIGVLGDSKEDLDLELRLGSYTPA